MQHQRQYSNNILSIPVDRVTAMRRKYVPHNNDVSTNKDMNLAKAKNLYMYMNRNERTNERK